MVKLGFDPKEVDQGLKKFERNLKETGRRMESIGKTMTIGFTAPFVLGMRQAIKAFDEEAQATRRLEVALGRTSTALITQAAAIQKTTIYADDAVLNIQAYAAALGHSEAQVENMTQAAVNLAAGLGIGLDQAMEMLHKSTLGAAKGLGNLLPGVKDMTKEQLKSGAAIDLVNQKFSGYAETLAKTGAGPLKQFENRFGDLMEQFGEAALPLLNKIIEKFEKLTDWFAKLSPETKEMLVNIGAFVALGGPILLMAGKVVTLTQSFIGLGTAIKGIVLAGAGIPALIASLAIASGYLTQNYTPMGGGFAGTIGKMVMKSTGGLYESSMINQNLGLIPGQQPAQNSGFLAPNASSKVVNLGGGGAGTKRNASDFLVPDNFGDPIGMEGQMMSGMGDNLGQITEALKGIPIKEITGDFERALPVLENFKSGVVDLKSEFIDMGSILGAAMGSIISSLEEGGKSFGEYAASAVIAIAKVIQAKMMELTISIVAGSASKGGLAGALFGLAASTAVIALVSKAMSSQKPPSFAEGGAVSGPTMAMMGDNPSGREMALPWEKTREFAGMIGSYMGGGGSSRVVGVIRGNDIHLVTSREQGFAARRGSGNLITF